MYQRAKGELDTLPFGTQRDVYAVGYEWINHSLAPAHPDHTRSRVLVGGPACTQPVLGVDLQRVGDELRLAQQE